MKKADLSEYTKYKWMMVEQIPIEQKDKTKEKRIPLLVLDFKAATLSLNTMREKCERKK